MQPKYIQVKEGHELKSIVQLFVLLPTTYMAKFKVIDSLD